MPPRCAWNPATREVDTEIWGVLDEPGGYINDFDPRHRQTQQKAQTRGQHLVRKHASVLGIIQELAHVVRAIGCAQKLGLRATPQSADVLNGRDASTHRHLLR